MWACTTTKNDMCIQSFLNRFSSKETLYSVKRCSWRRLVRVDKSFFSTTKIGCLHEILEKFVSCSRNCGYINLCRCGSISSTCVRLVWVSKVDDVLKIEVLEECLYSKELRSSGVILLQELLLIVSRFFSKFLEYKIYELFKLRVTLLFIGFSEVWFIGLRLIGSLTNWIWALVGYRYLVDS